MKANNKIFLALFVALLGFLAWDFQSEKKTAQQKTANLAVFSLKQDQIENIQIANADNLIELKRTLDGWQLVKPIQDEADSNFVEDFVQSSYTEVAKEVLSAKSEGFSWKLFGLEKPALSIKFTNSGGQAQTLHISEVKNFEKNIYARVDASDSVLVIPATWLGRAKRTAFDFRDRRLYRGSISAIKGLRHTIKGSKAELVTKEDRWQWKAHEGMKLDQNRVREFLSQINETKFSALESQTEADFQKSFNGAKIKLNLDLILSERTWFADMYQSSDRQLHIRVKDSKYPKAFVGILEAQNNSKFLGFNPQEFRDRNEAFAFDRSSVSEIEIQTSLKRTALKRAGDKWALVSEGTTTDSNLILNQKAVQNLLDKLTAAKIVEFKSDSAAAAKLENVLELRSASGKTLLKLSWGQPYLDKSDGGSRQLIPMKSSVFEQAFSMDEASINLWGLTNLIEKKQNK